MDIHPTGARTKWPAQKYTTNPQPVLSTQESKGTLRNTYAKLPPAAAKMRQLILCYIYPLSYQDKARCTHLIDSRRLREWDRDDQFMQIEVHAALVLNVDKGLGTTCAGPAVDGEWECRLFLCLEHTIHMCQKLHV